jgi:hypothetical protein
LTSYVPNYSTLWILILSSFSTFPENVEQGTKEDEVSSICQTAYF